MNPKDLGDILENLRDPFKRSIVNVAFNADKGNLRGLAQVISGPRRSGKTTEALAYAEALAKSALVDDKPPVLAYAGDADSDKDWNSLFKSAEKGVLIIDEIYKRPQNTPRDALHDLLLLAFDEPKCVVILTGEQEPMDNFMQNLRPELRARMPRPVTTEKSFSDEEIRGYHERIAEQQRLQQEREDRARSVALWRELSEDVTLKRAIAPMKGIILMRKHDTVH